MKKNRYVSDEHIDFEREREITICVRKLYRKVYVKNDKERDFHKTNKI